MYPNETVMNAVGRDNKVETVAEKVLHNSQSVGKNSYALVDELQNIVMRLAAEYPLDQVTAKSLPSISLPDGVFNAINSNIEDTERNQNRLFELIKHLKTIV